MRTKMKWFVISNDTGVVLAVYGSVLQPEANAKLVSLREEFPLARFYLHFVLNSSRPRVGQAISLRGSRFFGYF